MPRFGTERWGCLRAGSPFWRLVSFPLRGGPNLEKVGLNKCKFVIQEMAIFDGVPTFSKMDDSGVFIFCVQVVSCSRRAGVCWCWTGLDWCWSLVLVDSGLGGVCVLYFIK